MDFKPTIKFSLLQGIFWMTFSPIFAYASVYLLDKGLTNSKVGVVLGAGSIITVMVQPVMGGLADRAKGLILHKMIIALSILELILCAILLLVPSKIIVVSVVYTLIIAFSSVITPLTYSIGIYFMDRGIPINFGVCRGIGSIAYAIISAVIGVLLTHFDVSVIIMVTMMIYVLLIISVMCFHFEGIDEKDKRTNLPLKDKGKSANEAPDSLVSFIASHRRYLIVLFGNAIAFVSHNIAGNYTFQILQYHGYGSVEMGRAVFVSAACELPMLFAFSFIIKRIKSGTLYKVALFFMFVKTMCLYEAHGLLMIYIAMSLSILGYGLFAAAGVYYVNDTIENKNQVRGQALMTTTTSVGSVIGSFAGGIIIDKCGVPMMLLISSIMAFIGAAVVIFSAEKGKTSEVKTA